MAGSWIRSGACARCLQGRRLEISWPLRRRRVVWARARGVEGASRRAAVAPDPWPHASGCRRGGAARARVLAVRRGRRRVFEPRRRRA